MSDLWVVYSSRFKSKDFISKFRYLGKNDFSGYVLFSDPDGSFVEGYHYQSGTKDYVLCVKPVSESEEIIHSKVPKISGTDPICGPPGFRPCCYEVITVKIKRYENKLY